MYHSHTDEIADVNAGLIGPMIIAARGQTGTNGLPEGVDRELIVAFNEVSENESYYLRENIQTYTGRPDEVIVTKDPFGAIALVTPDPTVAPELNLMATMNGFLYGNLPGLTMRVGQRVRWYLMGTTNFELHAPHWHGNTVLIEERRSEVAALLTMGMIIAGHGAGQSRYLALSLPCWGSSTGWDVGSLHRGGGRNHRQPVSPLAAAELGRSDQNSQRTPRVGRSGSISSPGARRTLTRPRVTSGKKVYPRRFVRL